MGWDILLLEDEKVQERQPKRLADSSLHGIAAGPHLHLASPPHQQRSQWPFDASGFFCLFLYGQFWWFPFISVSDLARLFEFSCSLLLIS